MAESNDRLKIVLSGLDKEVIQRHRTTAGKPSGPTAKERFNFFAAVTIISGVITNVGRLINSVGTSDAAISASCGEVQLFEKTSEKMSRKKFTTFGS